ncbi:MAG TPA: hypothetical protein VJU18_16200 [Vicinamibacteria bacterium]|nr:hypothetical protein [Vicinamibacteria bacterium]
MALSACRMRAGEQRHGHDERPWQDGDHCDDDFGLKIEPAAGDLYPISFCGPGGCFEPGTYRPNSPIFGDQAYRVIDGNTLEVLGGDGFSKYYRCSSAPPK